MSKNINISVSPKQKDKLEKVCNSFEIRPATLFRDTIDNFLPFDEIPEYFINNINVQLLLKNSPPIRTILPYTASMLGYSLHGEWAIKDRKGNIYEIDPLPQCGRLCAIKIVEELWKRYRKC